MSTTKTLIPWFGAARMVAKAVGEELSGCKWVGIPFAGGMSEVLHITARSIVVNDLHRHIINLARIAAIKSERAWLIESLHEKGFHPDELEDAQASCLWWEDNWAIRENGTPSRDAARAYFVTQWQGRSAKAGTDGEFTGGISARWNANGGDSNTRYRSAIAALEVFGKSLERCNFQTLDCFEFIDCVQDVAEHGIYSDAPWPDDGDKYKHKFTEQMQRDWARRLTGFQHCRIVVRFGDHPLIRELYPEHNWRWRMIEGRTQANKSKAEVLIIRKR